MSLRQIPFDSINQDNMKLFFQYIAQRHEIYKKRLSNMPPPWTSDKILQQYKFTNVFRDLDPGTRYVIDNIIPKCDSAEKVIFNITIYRLFNKIETFEAVGIQDPQFKKKEFEIKIRELKSSGVKVFTNAFIVSGYSNIKGEDKIEKVTNIISEISSSISALADEIARKKDSEFTFLKIKSLQGIGNFLAYQICVDIGYWDKDLYDESTHVVCGPGCKRGLDRIFIRIKDYEECIRYLEEMQEKEFRKKGIDMDELFSDRKIKRLNLMSIENCLCEFSKYMKALNKEGRPRNRYRTIQHDPYNVNR